jgi:hypothetical protein
VETGWDIWFPIHILRASHSRLSQPIFHPRSLRSRAVRHSSHSVEIQLTYYAKVLRKASRDGIATITPQTSAANEFVDYCDSFFKQTVLTENCSSWYNSGIAGSRIHGLWPGSAAHVTMVRRDPRWEDYEYTYLGDGEGKNRFRWQFGNGWTKKEQDPKSDMTSYLEPFEREVDLRSLHEGWWE